LSAVHLTAAERDAIESTSSSTRHANTRPRRRFFWTNAPIEGLEECKTPELNVASLLKKAGSPEAGSRGVEVFANQPLHTIVTCASRYSGYTIDDYSEVKAAGVVAIYQPFDIALPLADALF